MSYKLRDDEPLGDGVRRIVCEEIETAIAAGRSEPNTDSSPVHETRKHLKKARAALRLVSAEVNRTAFKREDRRLRNVARLVSQIRDAEVRLETVKQLRNAPRGMRSSSIVETEELLAFELDSFLAAFSDWQQEAATKLKRSQTRIARWDLSGITRQHVCLAVRDSYKRGRRALRLATEHEGAKAFHELRKAAKELWYQLRVLRPLHPAVFHDMNADLKTLGQHLGHAHDLCFVAERLQAIAGSTRSRRGQRALEALIDSREKDLQRTAMALAERFYAENPKQFSDRIAEYFDEWERTKLRRSAQLVAA